MRGGCRVGGMCLVQREAQGIVVIQWPTVPRRASALSYRHRQTEGRKEIGSDAEHGWEAAHRCVMRLLHHRVQPLRLQVPDAELTAARAAHGEQRPPRPGSERETGDSRATRVVCEGGEQSVEAEVVQPQRAVAQPHTHHVQRGRGGQTAHGRAPAGENVDDASGGEVGERQASVLAPDEDLV